MADLKSILEYIKQTAVVLTIVTGMDVIICDTDGMILGDSSDEVSADHLNELSLHSVVREAIDEKKRIVIPEFKKENYNCRDCPRVSVCRISSIIAFPIMDQDVIVGGIGLYARTEDSKNLLIEKNDTVIAFIQQISEMLLGKLKEKEKSLAFEDMNERLRLLVESLDEAIIGVDENDNIINVNSKFYNMFSTPKGSIRRLEELFELLKNRELNEFIKQCLVVKAPSKTVIQSKPLNAVITFKPVFVGSNYKGALLYFKKSSEIYDEINKIKNNYSNITFRDIVGSSQEIRKLKETAEHFAKSPSTIFIQGKSGTGKEMFARAIHSASLISKGPFITVNCAAIPENLLESELFGHKEGAFTGSMRGGKVGKFEFANRGTLFLDEVGEMPLHLQPKLLRAIQERKIQPVGANNYISVDIRIIAATNRDMESMIANGQFREDLYYRLNVIPLFIPELRERRSDILDLMDLFVGKYNAILDKNILGFDDGAKELLYHYDWPGNIRELQNIVEYAVNDCRGKYITTANLPAKDYAPRTAETNISLRPLKDVERLLIQEALKRYGNTPKGKEQAAGVLGMGRSTFYRKLKELGIT